MERAADQDLLDLLSKIDADVTALLEECECVDGHRLSEWSARFEQHGGAVWPEDAQPDAVPPWMLNAPYLSGALKIVSKSLQDAADARLRGDGVGERVARDRAYCFSQLASASAWCTRRLVLDGGAVDT
jgi:hypothetical protein